MKYLVVVPYVYEPYFQEFIRTVKIPRENILLVNNTVNNRGIMRSHNMGIDLARERGADWLIIMSAAIRFGEAGGLDFIQLLEDHMDHHVIHGASANVAGGMQSNPDGGGGNNKVFGWHLTAFRTEVFENIGRWDENFTPYGFDDIDMSLRIRKHYKERTKWETYPCDVLDTTMGHSIKLAQVEAPSEPRIAYFVNKWGRHPGAWQWDGWEHPFNEEYHNLKFWPIAPNGGKWDETINIAAENS